MKRSKFELSDFVPVKSLEEILCDLVAREQKTRKEKRITQKELARKTGISYASIRRFETTGNISFLGLLKIANVLGCLEDFDSVFKEKEINDLEEFFR